MWLSETPKAEIVKLDTGKQTQIVFGDFENGCESADVALLLGCDIAEMRERAFAAASLYKSGRVRYIIPTGGPLRDDGNRKISEADFMAEVLLESGVPREAVIVENGARTTKENMIFGTLMIDRILRLENGGSVIIVTSPYHIRRSVALAKWLMPHNLEIYGYACESCHKNRENWFLHADVRKQVCAEIGLMMDLICAGVIDDIEY